MESRDRELEEYRDLILPPKTFSEGFNLKTIIGALFIGFIMMPGSIYLGLVAGQGMGPAAQWVTIILFMEIARRSFTVLTKQELYILYYIAGGIIAGGPFGGFIWNQFFIQSPAAASFAHLIPKWVSPPANSEAIIQRTFMHIDWLPAIGVMLASWILGRLNWFSLGYLLFRLTSDVEKLPFPMAPIAVQGATALAESFSKDETWRWRVFSIGTIIGIVFGAFYIGIPTISGLVLLKPVQLLPIPWMDFTTATESILPATPLGLVTSLGTLLIGFVLPFWIVVGGFIAAAGTMIVNPILYKAHVLTTWRPGMDTFHTSFANQIDFWLSFSIGTGLAVALFGVYEMIKVLKKKKLENSGPQIKSFAPPAGRGDFPISIAIILFIISTVGIIWLCSVLVPNFPIWFFILFGVVITPLTSYINARLSGITGQFVGFPMLRESTFILSGYQGVAVWFAPLPLADHGGCAQFLREVELTGTKISSIIKAELIMFPIILVCSFLFWGFIWKLAPIPSAMYPFTQKTWYFNAMGSALWISSTTGTGTSFLLEALKLKFILSGMVFGLGAYAGLVAFGLPTLMIYGFIRGMGSLPHGLFLEMFGALLGRYYFMKKFGVKQWRDYAPVLFAGFACGMGLIGMGCAAIALIAQSVSKLPY